MNRTVAVSLALAATVEAPAKTPDRFDPVAFFTGRTEGTGTLKELAGKARRTSTHGMGRIEPDGSLLLEQKIFVEGEPPRLRRWNLRQVGPGKYRGTLNNAKGPVEVDVTSSSAHVRYLMKGGIKVEQRLAPLPGGRSISNLASFRKFGVKVATLSERIEKR